MAICGYGVEVYETNTDLGTKHFKGGIKLAQMTYITGLHANTTFDMPQGSVLQLIKFTFDFWDANTTLKMIILCNIAFYCRDPVMYVDFIYIYIQIYIYIYIYIEVRMIHVEKHKHIRIDFAATQNYPIIANNSPNMGWTLAETQPVLQFRYANYIVL